MTTNHRLLRSALGANSAITGLLGLVLAAGGAALAPRFGLPGPWPLWAVAAVFLGFAALLGKTALAPRNLPLEAKLLTLLDVGYVAGTITLLGLFPGTLNGAGRAAAIAVAALVVVLVAAQTAGMRRLARGV